MATLMQCLRDITDLTYQGYQCMTNPWYLTGSTEQVSDHLDALTAQERWDRDAHVVDDRAFILQAEEQMAMADLRHAHQMFRFTAGTVKRMFHLKALDAIRIIRGLRWERAELAQW